MGNKHYANTVCRFVFAPALCGVLHQATMYQALAIDCVIKFLQFFLFLLHVAGYRQIFQRLMRLFLPMKGGK